MSDNTGGLNNDARHAGRCTEYGVKREGEEEEEDASVVVDEDEDEEEEEYDDPANSSIAE